MSPAPFSHQHRCSVRVSILVVAAADCRVQSFLRSYEPLRICRSLEDGKSLALTLAKASNAGVVNNTSESLSFKVLQLFRAS